MVKRKAEGSPCIDSEPKLSVPEDPLPGGTPTPEQSITALAPAEGGPCERVPEGQLDPVTSDVVEAAEPVEGDFWSLLALIGYETWKLMLAS